MRRASLPSLVLLLALALPALTGQATAEEPRAKPPAKQPPAKKAPAKRALRWANYDLVAKASEHTTLARCASFAPDGKTFATGGSDRALRIWDSVTGKVLAVHQLPRAG